MKQLIDQGIFFNIDQSLVEIETLLNKNTFLPLLFENHKHSALFQKQLTINIYHYLSILEDEMLYDDSKVLDRPLISLIVNLVSMSDDIKQLKSLHRNNKFLLLLVSLFISKKMTKFIYNVLEESQQIFIEENVLDLIHISELKGNLVGFEIIDKLQKTIILEIKGTDYSKYKFAPYIKEAIYNAKKLENIILQGESFYGE